MTGAVKQDSPLEVLAFRIDLSFVVEGPKLGHQVSGVLCCVHSQRLGDDEERPSKLSDSQLLSGTLTKQKRRGYFSTDAQQVNAQQSVTTVRMSHHACGIILKVD